MVSHLVAYHHAFIDSSSVCAHVPNYQRTHPLSVPRYPIPKERTTETSIEPIKAPSWYASVDLCVDGMACRKTFKWDQQKEAHYKSKYQGDTGQTVLNSARSLYRGQKTGEDIIKHALVVSTFFTSDEEAQTSTNDFKEGFLWPLLAFGIIGKQYEL